MAETRTTGPGRIVDEPLPEEHGDVEMQLKQLRWEQGQNLRAIKLRLTWAVWLLAIPYIIIGGMLMLGFSIGAISGMTL